MFIHITVAEELVMPESPGSPLEVEMDVYGSNWCASENQQEISSSSEVETDDDDVSPEQGDDSGTYTSI